MKKINVFMLALLTLFLISSKINAQWTTFSNPSNKALHSVYFINSMTGFTCGDTGTVLKSTTGGTSWVNSNTGISGSINVSDIQFLDENTGYCTGGVGSLSGKIYKSTNGGSSWVQVFDTTGTGFRTLFFINANTGWAVAALGVIKYTSNGGTSWQSRNVNISSLTDVVALLPDTVFVSGFTSGGSIVKSTNGGVNWVFTSVPGEFADFKFVMFTNSLTGYAGGLKFGGNGVMGKTTNGGLNWTTLPGYVSATPYEAASVSDDIIYVVRTDDTLSTTIDGGVTWNKQYVPTGGFDKSISINSGVGCIAGRNSLAVNTTLGVQQISNEIPERFSLNQNYPNPFNPETNIAFEISERISSEIIIYNSLGQKVRSIFNEVLSPGTYNVRFDASSLPGGVYFYRLRAGDYSLTKKMILIK